MRKMVRERDNERSLKWFLAAGVAVVVLLILFLPGCASAPKPYWEQSAKERIASMKNRETKKQETKKPGPSKPVEVREETSEEKARRLDYQERQARARYNGDARPIQQPVRQASPVTPERVTEAEPSWKQRLREYQQAIGEPYEEYVAPTPVDPSDPVFSIPRVEPRDVNNDGLVTCIDWAISFYLKWGERYGYKNIALMYNSEEKEGGSAHLFVMVNGKPWDYNRQEYLQPGKRYGNATEHWTYRVKNNEVITLDDWRWESYWSPYDGKGY